MSREDAVEEDQEDTQWFVYKESLIERCGHGLGYLLGWAAYFIAKRGFLEAADRLIDKAIVLHRNNPGAVRATGRLNACRGLPALRRGKLLVTGTIHGAGPFANRRYFAAYHVAAPNKARALALIRRFEWDAIPDSIQIEEGELDIPDPGAEGVLWVSPGRIFFSDQA